MDVKIVPNELGREFTADANSISMCKTIKMMIDDLGEDEDTIYLPMINAACLEQVIRFCDYYAQDPMTPFEIPLASLSLSDLVQQQYVQFAMSMFHENIEFFYEMLDASECLDNEPLQLLLFAACAVNTANKSPEEIIAFAGLDPSLYTPEDLEKISNETPWTSYAMAKTAGKDYYMGT